MGKRKPPGRVWQPFQEATIDTSKQPPGMKGMMDDGQQWRIFKNNLYTVQTAIEPSGMSTEEFPEGMPVLHISIRRNDRKTIRSWRDLQRIKSEIAGADCDAMELFPAEERTLDGANQYHLYALPAGMRFPFGIWNRSVADEGEMDDLMRKMGIPEEQIERFPAKQEPFEWDKDISVDEPGMVPGFSDLVAPTPQQRREDEMEEEVARDVYGEH